MVRLFRGGSERAGSFLGGVARSVKREQLVLRRSSRSGSRVARSAAQQPNFHTAILRAAFTRVIVCNRTQLAKSQHVHSKQRDIVMLGKIPANRVGPLFGELVVVSV